MTRFRERLYKWIFTVLAFASLVFLVGIILTLLLQALPALRQLNLVHFIFGQHWYPTYEPPEFGIFPLIAASILVTFGAMVVCVPIGIGSALYIHL